MLQTTKLQNPHSSWITRMSRHFIIYFLLLLSASSLLLSVDGEKVNPFTAKAALIRYWNNQISNNLPKPAFLLSKASPLTAVDSALLSKLASQNALSTHLLTFCSLANLFCQFDSQQQQQKPRQNADFSSYTSKPFTNYGSSSVRGTDSFKNYSVGINMPTNSFTRYSSSSSGHNEMFTNYADNANVGDDGFTGYAAGSVGGSGQFSRYESDVNVPNLRFTSYDSNSHGHRLSFANYTEDSNSGREVFTSYGKAGNGVPMEFNNYGKTSNILGSTFTGYSEKANSANETFKGYSSDGNNPFTNFKSYSAGVNSGVDSFVNYRDGANVGHDEFQSYGKNAKSTKASFINYGKSFNEGTDKFNEYGKGSTSRVIEFKSYGVNNTFKGYGDNKGISFARYTNKTSTKDGKSRSRWVEEGKFFRESMLKPGSVMRMPDIKDKMPKRSFLPRSILNKLPFSTSKINEIFNARPNSNTERVIKNTMEECKRAPSKGETKKCVGSVEDMIDFAVSILGHNVNVRSTENVKGSGEKVIIGEVRGINGGRVTQSVSCHQSMFPYLLYYCHSVPKVRVYEADILSLNEKVKVNHGVAVCHLDTSSWSAGHGAFMALGFGPGLIEVCHWIFENDMTWNVAD